MPVGRREFWESWDAKSAPFRARPVIIADLTERLELPAPFGWRIAQPFNSNAAWQTTFDRGPHEVWREEGEREGHVDLTHAALLTCCDLLNVGHGARNDLVKPATTSGDSADEACATFDPG